MLDDRTVGWVGVLTLISTRFSALWVSYLASSVKLGELERLPWHDPTLGRRENKDRMKEVGAAVFGYRQWLLESFVLLLSKILEDVWVELRREFGIDFKLWEVQDLDYVHQARLVRSLANVIKHNQGVVSPESRSGRYLIENCGFPSGIPIDVLSYSAPALVRPEDLTPQLYLFSIAVADQAAGRQRAIMPMPEEERLAAIRSLLVPQVLRLPAHGLAPL